MPTTLRIAPIALNPTSRKVLEVAISLINDENADCQLLMGDNTQADLLIIDGDDEMGRHVLASARDEQVKLVISQQRQQGNNLIWQEPPVRVTDMQDVLSRICRRMQTAVSEPEPEQATQLSTNADEDAYSSDLAATETTEDTAREENVGTHEAIQPPPEASNIATGSVAKTAGPEAPPAEIPPPKEAVGNPQIASLFHVLLNIRLQKICQQITTDSDCIFVNGQDGTVLAEEMRHIQAVLTTPPQQLQLEQMDVIGFAEQTQGLHLSPLDNLLWQAGVDHCDGQLLAGHDADQPVRLKAWPNFTRNGFRQSHFKLATIMAKQPISLNDLCKESGVAKNEIISFYNAAYAVGLIDKTNTLAAHSAKNSKQLSQRKGLFGKLANKFRRR